jgi:hypothetical protein
VQGRALHPNEQKQGEQPMNQESQLSLLHRQATDSPALKRTRMPRADDKSYYLECCDRRSARCGGQW